MTDRWQRDTCAIAGVGQSAFSKNSGVSVTALAADAALAALADAGIDPADVDGIVRNDMDLVSCAALGDAIGARNLTYYGEAGPGGSGPCAMVAQAVAAIMSGQADTVVVFRSLNGRSRNRFGLSAELDPVIGGAESFTEFFGPYGLLSPGMFFALIAQQYMNETGLKSEQLANIALVARKHANNNPAAQMHHRPMTLDDYMDSRMLSTPLRLFDYCLETDGAAAVVVTTTERAKDLRQPPAVIRAAAMASGPRPQPGQMYPVLMREDPLSMPSRQCAETLYARAGLGPEDIDSAQLYDCFSITALLQIEDYGFCARGEAGAFIESGELEVGGAMPFNTSGGHMSEGYIHGMNHVVEGVRQIRGQSSNQVQGASVSLVTSAPPPSTAALILVSASSARLAPRVDDPASRGFFELAAEGKLGVLTCTDCGTRIHLPRPRCVGCGGNNLAWSAVAGRGRAKSWTVVEHQVHPLFPVPYTVVLIDVHGEQNVRMIGHLPGRVDVDETTEFVVEFEDLGPDLDGNARVLPKWAIAKERVGDNRTI